MIAADTSTWIAFIAGDNAEDVRLLDRALDEKQVLMIPAVLTELLSDSKLPQALETELLQIPLIEIELGYWQRAGVLRAKILAKKRRARLADVLIAQTCIDRGVPLLTRDRDFQAFAEAVGLSLVNYRSAS
jgi:predicted nucleic acid-binding protein